MASLTLEELSADTALQANSLELLPGQEQFVTPITYENEETTLDHTKTWSRVIVSDGEVVGFIRAHFEADHPSEELRCCIWRVSVAANTQGQGVGRFAIEAAREEAKRQGFDTLTVVFEPGEAGPGPFFQKLGFRDIGVTAYGDTIGALELS
jgi:diamine N-acetyltransferase